MPVPDYQTLMRPALQALVDAGPNTPSPLADVRARIIDAEGLTPDDLSDKLASGGSVFVNRDVQMPISALALNLAGDDGVDDLERAAHPPQICSGILVAVAVACITQVASVMIAASYFCPRHRNSPIQKKFQLLEITQLNFQSRC